MGEEVLECIEVMVPRRYGRSQPLIGRKVKLGTLLKRFDHPTLRYSEPFRDPDKLLTECSRRGLEGIVSKRITALNGVWGSSAPRRPA